MHSTTPSQTTLSILLSCAVLATWTPAPAVAAGPRGAQPRFRIHDLGVLPGRAAAYVINGHCLNNRGQVVGWSNDGGPYAFQDDSAFIGSSRDGLQPLAGLPGAAVAVALALNDHGSVVGFSGDPFPMSLPTIWTRDGARALPVPEGHLGGMALGINNRGVIGGFLVSVRGTARAVVWADGEPVFLPLTGEADPVQGACYALNDRGLIVGMSDLKPALWDQGRIIPLGTFGGARGQANGVNERNQVVGFSADATGAPHAFLWEDGAMMALTTDEPYTVALSINGRGQIVGAAGAGHPSGDAVLWHRGQRVMLADTIAADSGWILIEADCINDRGQIAGLGLLNGKPRVFLLTP